MKSLQPMHLVSIMLWFSLHQNVFSYVEQYKLVLAETGRTVMGTSTSLPPMPLVQCATKCSMSNCIAWSWNDISRECLIFSAFLADFNVGIPVKSAPPEVHTYLPMSNSKKFIIILLPYDPTLTWQSARDACLALGEDLIHVPDNDDMAQLSDFLGNLWMGITRDAPGSGNFRMLNNTIIDEGNLFWKIPNPDNNSGDQSCMSYFKLEGYDDVPCNSRLSTDPQTAVCTHTEA